MHGRGFRNPSNPIREIEKETKLTIFSRSRQGIALTKEGLEFLGYARNVVQQMELLEGKYITSVLEKYDLQFPHSITNLHQMPLLK
jgi:hypothetical protein